MSYLLVSGLRDGLLEWISAQPDDLYHENIRITGKGRYNPVILALIESHQCTRRNVVEGMQLN